MFRSGSLPKMYPLELGGGSLGISKLNRRTCSNHNCGNIRTHSPTSTMNNQSIVCRRLLNDTVVSVLFKLTTLLKNSHKYERV